MSAAQARFRFRLALGFFVIGLAASGLTAFPLSTELNLIVHALGWDQAPVGMNSLSDWVRTVQLGLEHTYGRYPWIAYGTDWLAFGHLAIALFFIEPWLRPGECRGVLRAGVAACILVIPLALVCGAMRGIPLYWRLVDCSFGLIGLVPLLYCLHLLPALADRGSLEGR